MDEAIVENEPLHYFIVSVSVNSDRVVLFEGEFHHSIENPAFLAGGGDSMDGRIWAVAEPLPSLYDGISGVIAFPKDEAGNDFALTGADIAVSSSDIIFEQLPARIGAVPLPRIPIGGHIVSRGGENLLKAGDVLDFCLPYVNI